ncbi:MAG TPA: hypothetical protein DHW02_03860 [Ktedonobacter sp.]|nr:hypothetical protein [Ktedonobacter sp.]
MNIVFWILQVLVALAFLAAGAMKTFSPISTLSKNMSWTAQTPAVLVRLIGICEILGGLGLILPPMFHILPWLTIAAAIGLAIIMVGAVIFHIARKEIPNVTPSAVLLILAILIIVGRIAIVPFTA